MGIWGSGSSNSATEAKKATLGNNQQHKGERTQAG